MLNQIEKKTATRLDTYIFYQTLHSLNLHNYKNGFLRHLCNDELTFLNCISSAALGYLNSYLRTKCGKTMFPHERIF
jgi:hypothetical protein